MPGRSTILQLLRTIDGGTEELKNANEVDAVNFVFRKPSDSVSHQRLPGSIAGYGNQGKTPSWIRDFLLNSKQRVVINKQYSKWATVRSGIPQRLVRGLVLVIIFIYSRFKDGLSNNYLYADHAII